MNSLKKRIQKFRYVFTLASTSYVGMALMSQVPSTYQVGKWYQFKTAAISYTFDDNCSNQIPKAFPLLDQYGFKGTLFTVTQSMNPNWTNIKNSANNGHEVASHTVTHADLSTSNTSTQDTELKNSQSTINSQIPTKKCVTVAYPNCNIGDLATIQKYYIAGRICSGQIISSSPSDFYRLSSIICGSTGVNTSSEMNNRANSAKSSGGWCCFLIHGIDNDGGYSPLASSVLGDHLTNVNTNKADYWVGTFGNVVKYIKERNAINITETSVSADSLRMTPVDNLDNTIYDAALTIRRQLPANWTSARVRLSGTIVTSAIVTVNNVKYIEFDITPDKGVYTIANPNAVINNCTTPSAPAVSNISYCQNASATALTATASAGNSLVWYGTNSTGGTASTSAPTPSTSMAGSTSYYVAQKTNTGNCESPRATIVVTINASVTPSIQISSSIGTNINGSQSPLLTATVTNGGSNPTFVWIKNKVEINGATSSTYQVQAPVNDGDSYSATVTSNANCANPTTASSTTMMFHVVTSIYDMDLTNISIYPNPANGQIKVEGLNDQFEYSIQDNSGKQMLNGTSSSLINVQHLEKGVYNLSIKTNINKKVLKIIIE